MNPLSKNDIQWAEVELSPAGEPLSTRFGDCYYSKGHGPEEVEYVFIQQNSLPGAWMDKPLFTIGEIGFGTGLSFFTTIMQWEKTKAPGSELRFISMEKYPLRPEEFKRVSEVMNGHPNKLKRLFLEQYSEMKTGWNSFCFPDKQVKLDLFIGDALAGLRSELFPVDAWFYDGFAPAKNPELWNDEMFKAISHHSHIGTTLATFTAAGFVRRGLEKHGFKMEKIKGFGKKREMLRGVME